MKTTFSPKLFYNPLTAISVGTSALQTLGGLAQSIIGGGRQKRATQQLEKLVNNYKTNDSILDYYSKALQRYNVNPYTSALYRQQQDQIRGGTAQAINSLQDRRSVMGGLSSVVQGQNDGLLRAAAAAEGQQAQALNELGQATGMKAGEDRYKFENKANLLAMKASGGSNIMNAGFSNIFGGLQGAGMAGMYNNEYGGGTGRNSGGTTSTNSNVGVSTDWLMRNRPRKPIYGGG